MVQLKDDGFVPSHQSKVSVVQLKDNGFVPSQQSGSSLVQTRGSKRVPKPHKVLLVNWYVTIHGRYTQNEIAVA